MNGRLTLLGMILCVLAEAGCQTGPKIQPPTAGVARVELIEQTPQGVRLQLVIVMENPNQIPLPLEASQYTVVLNGQQTFSYTDRPKRTIPAGGRQVLELPAVFKIGGRKLSGSVYTVTGTVSYRPPGQFQRFLTESGLPLPSVEYRASGTVR